jgi:hypothetical protein
MTEDDFFAIIDPPLRSLGSTPEVGEEFATPPLDVLRYYRRTVRLHWIPLLGNALSLVAVVRQPTDIGINGDDYRRLATRVAMAVNSRFPPWRRRSGLAVGIALVVLTPEPIAPEDDAILGGILGQSGRSRGVLMGVLRVNLGQEAISFALAPGPDGLFPESESLADALTPRFRRFVPLIKF